MKRSDQSETVFLDMTDLPEGFVQQRFRRSTGHASTGLDVSRNPSRLPGRSLHDGSEC
jgi:hypothetical protein